MPNIDVPIMYLPLGGLVMWVMLVLIGFVLATAGAITYNPQGEQVDQKSRE